MEPKKKRKAYVKYPKIVTVTCVSCAAVIEVRLEDVSKFSKRFYCSEECERQYLARARRNAVASRTGNGTFGGGRGKYQELVSQFLAERPAGGDAPKKLNRKTAEAIAAAAAAAARKQRDLEYWAALRRAMGITGEAVAE